jgi:hypothetical protein
MWPSSPSSRTSMRGCLSERPGIGDPPGEVSGHPLVRFGFGFVVRRLPAVCGLALATRCSKETPARLGVSHQSSSAGIPEGYQPAAVTRSNRVVAPVLRGSQENPWFPHEPPPCHRHALVHRDPSS